ncbi:LCP family protein [Bifidobacterium sp. ESL0763]|uniref:LCP family protein n=1 Tax=Bifidobacterium sp. ESL0763 TaxID=2983227 RepID=UPI0023F99A5F|nr:LCP family protein [Bifidobacterium sp. ESL0763]MDF7663985.1 LCP family protein [Bifidobacterium sp. ESL0763]
MARGTDGDGAQGNPPSFIPTGTHRHTPASAQSRSSSASPSRADSDQPAAYRPLRQRRRSTTGRTTARKSGIPAAASAAPSPSRAGSDQPAAYTPLRQRRRSTTGSSRNATRTTARKSGTTAAAVVSNTPRTPEDANGKPRKHHHRILITLVILVLAIALTLFGCWNWVNGQLDKGDWLTDKSDTVGTSWLILGSDERDSSGIGGTESDTPGFRTDTILVLTKPVHGNSSLVSIPRDSLVKYDGDYMKINAVSELYGKSSLVGAVEDITGQKIDHVAQIKFSGLNNVVNALGGVRLCYDHDVDDPYSGMKWQSGCHTVDGGSALAFSRMRYSDPQGDFGRAARQRQLIGAIMSKALSSSTLGSPSKVKGLAQATLKAVQVDRRTNPATLLSMARAFKSATGKQGITGSVYWTDPEYYVDGVGSAVLLDDARNQGLFDDLAHGVHKPGTVGTAAENVTQ